MIHQLRLLFPTNRVRTNNKINRKIAYSNRSRSCHNCAAKYQQWIKTQCYCTCEFTNKIDNVCWSANVFWGIFRSTLISGFGLLWESEHARMLAYFQMHIFYIRRCIHIQRIDIHLCMHIHTHITRFQSCWLRGILRVCQHKLLFCKQNVT